MQFIEVGDKDLESGFNTYCLKETDKGVDFFTYTGDTAMHTDEKGLAKQRRQSRNFLRKGFLYALDYIDFNVMYPVYTDKNGSKIENPPKDEVRNLIYKDELGIKGFKFKDNVSKEKKNEEISKIIDSFVTTSKNLDFASEKNLFIVMSNLREVAYNNGGSKTEEFTGFDIQKKLGIDVTELKRNKVKSTPQLAKNIEKEPEVRSDTIKESKNTLAEKPKEPEVCSDTIKESKNTLAEKPKKPEASQTKERTIDKILENKNAILERLYNKHAKADNVIKFQDDDDFYQEDFEVKYEDKINPSSSYFGYDLSAEDELKVAKDFIKQNHFPDEELSNGDTLFMRLKSNDARKFLLDNDADINAVDSAGCTALAYCQTKEEAQFLLDNGANPLLINENGKSMLEELKDCSLTSYDNLLLSYQDKDGKPVNVYEHSEEQKEMIALVESRAKKMKLEQLRNKVKKPREVSGVVIADKIAEKRINGIIPKDVAVTPEIGKQLSDNIKKMMMRDKGRDK